MAVSKTRHHKSALDLLLEEYKLKKKDVNKQISAIHLDKISHYCCSQWRRLPAYLEMDRIVKDDVDRLSTNEEAEKRSSFFSKWGDEKGSEATYEKIINALLEMKCKKDAEKVCKLIRPASKLHRSPQPTSDHRIVTKRPPPHQASGQRSKLPPLLQASDHRVPTGISWLLESN